MANIRAAFVRGDLLKRGQEEAPLRILQAQVYTFEMWSEKSKVSQELEVVIEWPVCDPGSKKISLILSFIL